MAAESKVTDPKAGPKAAAPKTPEAKTPEAKAEYIRAVYGRMVDPLTALEYTGVPSELYKRTGWVDSQLEAKKLELCDPPDQSTRGSRKPALCGLFNLHRQKTNL